ncbi:RL44 [Hepatospora eriocheir]|uniref:RL44 n=1 Tax=Hepatospora eriocheir TaxID=1081669 RepID=A0A1X0QGD3_9MICR|nr:RL44 [Hepatospora eriocheir]ORD98724.1 RL44 [Hepatospora eriocheir]
MVNIPKEKSNYCVKCNTHTSSKVSIYKKGKDNPMRAGNRRYRLKQKGFGGQTKPILKRKAKNTKKVTLKIKCSQCSGISMKPLKRAKQAVVSNEKKSKGEAFVY